MEPRFMLKITVSGHSEFGLVQVQSQPRVNSNQKRRFYQLECHGKVKWFKADAIIISTLCNIDRKGNLLFVSILLVDKFTGKVDGLYFKCISMMTYKN